MRDGRGVFSKERCAARRKMDVRVRLRKVTVSSRTDEDVHSTVKTPLATIAYQSQKWCSALECSGLAELSFSFRVDPENTLERKRKRCRFTALQGRPFFR